MAQMNIEFSNIIIETKRRTVPILRDFHSFAFINKIADTGCKRILIFIIRELRSGKNRFDCNEFRVEKGWGGIPSVTGSSWKESVVLRMKWS